MLAAMATSFVITLLAVGFIRVGIWATGAFIAVTHRQTIAAAGLVAATLNSIVFALSNAGVDVPTTIQTIAAVAATPIAGFIVGGIHRLLKALEHERSQRLALERALHAVGAATDRAASHLPRAARG